MSVNIYDKVTGELIQIAGNANGVIDDANVSNTTTYSSQKIVEEIAKSGGGVSQPTEIREGSIYYKHLNPNLVTDFLTDEISRKYKKLIDIEWESGTLSGSDGSLKPSEEKVRTKKFKVQGGLYLKTDLPLSSQAIIDIFEYDENDIFIKNIGAQCVHGELTMFFDFNELHYYRIVSRTLDVSSFKFYTNKIKDDEIELSVGTINNTGNLSKVGVHFVTNLFSSSNFLKIKSDYKMNITLFKYGSDNSFIDKQTNTAQETIFPLSADYKYRVLILSNNNITIDKIDIKLIESSDGGYWTGRLWTAYGDSITEQYKWEPLVTKELGLRCINKGSGGTYVADATYESPTKFSFSADERINTIDENSELVTIMGGTNDWGMKELGDLTYPFDTTKFKGALAETVRKMQIRCPNAVIVVMSNVGGRGSTGVEGTVPLTDSRGLTPFDFAKAAEEVARFMGVYFIDVWSCGINCFNRTKYIADAVHPNDEGGKLIARKVIEGLKNIKY